MTLYNQPCRLEILSQMAFAEYVSELCVQLVKLKEPNDDCVNSSKLLNTQQLCRFLQDRLHETVPHILANDLTSQILQHLDYCYKDIRDKFNEAVCKTIVQEFVKATLHPEMTVLDLTWDWTYIVQFITNQIHVLKKLKVLKLTKRHISALADIIMCYDEKWVRPLVNSLNSLSHLETLSILFGCNDDVLETVRKSCRNLKNLDVTSSTGVTDRSISNILKLTNLEELKLEGTSISEAGYMELIEGMSIVNVDENLRLCKGLKSFGCDCYSTSQLEYIVSTFTELTQVSLTARRCDVSVLRKLHDLQMLSLKSGGFSQVKELLLAKGNQLLELNLDLDFNAVTDLKLIAEQCPFLISLSVLGDTYARDKNDCKLFPTIKHLTLQTRNAPAAEYLLSRCPNLTTLEFCSIPDFYNNFIQTVLTKNCLNCLTELTIGSLTYNLPSDKVRFIIEHCKSLTLVKLFGFSNAEMEALCDEFPGIRLTYDSRWQLPKIEVTFRSM